MSVRMVGLLLTLSIPWVAHGALGAREEGDPAALVQQYRAAEGKPSVEQQRGEYDLAQNLLALGFPAAASGYFGALLKDGPKAPFYGLSLQGLMTVQQQLNDEYLIPSAVAGQEKDAFAALAPEIYARLVYLIGTVEQRKGQFQRARAHLEAVPNTSPVYAKARYLLGIVVGDSRYPGGPQFNAALAAFREVLALKDSAQEGLPGLQKLAQLAVARTYYGMTRYPESVAAYEAIPRFSTYWDQALFENGFARFRNGDWGGALGSLQSLHAPQFAGSLQPESWILKGTIYFFSCLYDESRASLTEFDRLYSPVIQQLRPLATDNQKDLGEYYMLVSESREDVIPKSVLAWIRSNERMLGVFHLLQEQEKERQRLNGMREILGTPAQAGLVSTLEARRTSTVQVAGTLAKNRLVEAYRNLKSFSDQAEIIKFETSKADKESVEQGFDQKAALSHQRLYRPKNPGENWDYWKFDGEFWIDEIGSYRYTLKNGCANRKMP